MSYEHVLITITSKLHRTYFAFLTNVRTSHPSLRRLLVMHNLTLCSPEYQPDFTFWPRTFVVYLPCSSGRALRTVAAQSVICCSSTASRQDRTSWCKSPNSHSKTSRCPSLSRCTNPAYRRRSPSSLWRLQQKTVCNAMVESSAFSRVVA